jgi:glycosyltransferase involved in cell wall biosynthesis
MRIIHLVDNAEMINYGVWNAAISNAEQLNDEHIAVELWYPGTANPAPVPVSVQQVKLAGTGIDTLKSLINTRDLDKEKDIIISHGCWQYPTRWGHYLKGQGFRWVYVPHGMLEPWSMQQKRLKKLVFFYLVERRMAVKADTIRAVSTTEQNNLHAFFPKDKVRFMPNAIAAVEETGNAEQGSIRYLFLSRLHAKKNLLSLAEAWVSSSLNNRTAVSLIFAGPDQGELEGLQSYIKQSNNIQYLGSVYGREKDRLIRSCTYYVLPSFSEGLPSSLLESMSAGLVPIITEGCNLPDVFTLDMGFEIKTDAASIRAVLEHTANLDKQVLRAKSARCRNYVEQFFSLKAVTKEQVIFFRRLLPLNL